MDDFSVVCLAVHPSACLCVQFTLMHWLAEEGNLIMCSIHHSCSKKLVPQNGFQNFDTFRTGKKRQLKMSEMEKEV